MENYCFKEFDDKFGMDNSYEKSHRTLYCDGNSCEKYQTCPFGKNIKRIPLSRSQLKKIAYLGNPKI